MAYIPYPTDGPLSEADHILRICGWSSDAARAHVSLYRAVMFAPSPLTRLEREAMAVAVSAANSCHY